MSEEPSKNKPHGEHTHELASGLAKSLVADTYELFADPHAKEHELPSPVNNAEVSLHFGKEGTWGTSLSDCDIMITSRRSRSAVLLIEVEEKEGGPTPKTIIGDVFTVWMAEAIRCKGKPYELMDTSLWVVVFEPSAGGKAEQYTALQDRLDKLREPVQRELHGRVHVTATKIVRIKAEPDSFAKKVVEEIRSGFPKLFVPSVSPA